MKLLLIPNQTPISCVTCKDEIGLVFYFMDHGKLETGHRVNFITFFFFNRSGYQNAPEVSDGWWNLLVSRAFADGRDGGSSGTGLCHSWYGIVLSLSHVS